MSKDAEMKVRHVGMCAVCGRDQKVRLVDGAWVMVHHGFRRPGRGSIVGDCFAVHREPYEKSCQAAVDFRGMLVQALEGKRDFQARLESGEVTLLSSLETEYSYDYPSGRLRTVDYAVGVTPAYRWERELTAKISSVKSEIGWLETDLREMDARIAAWPGRSVTEVREVVEEKKLTRREQRIQDLLAKQGV